MEKELLDCIREQNNQIVNLIELNNSMVRPVLAENKALHEYVRDLEKKNLELEKENGNLSTKLKLETFDMNQRIEAMEQRFEAMGK
jgi:hypothetical protein